MGRLVDRIRQETVPLVRQWLYHNKASAATCVATLFVYTLWGPLAAVLVGILSIASGVVYRARLCQEDRSRLVIVWLGTLVMCAVLGAPLAILLALVLLVTAAYTDRNNKRLS